MKHRMLFLLAVGMSGGLGMTSIVQTASAADQSDAGSQTKSVADVDSAEGKPGAGNAGNPGTGPQANTTKAFRAKYAADQKQAATEYSAATAKCTTRAAEAVALCAKTYKNAAIENTGDKTKCSLQAADSKSQCMKDAKAAETVSLADAKSRWENGLTMVGRAKKEPAAADSTGTTMEPKSTK